MLQIIQCTVTIPTAIFVIVVTGVLSLKQITSAFCNIEIKYFLRLRYIEIIWASELLSSEFYI